MQENRVIIYSSGVADFLRWYTVAADTKTSISIPVGSDHLADLLASFNVFGEVQMETPPTFRPSNETEGRLTIDPENVLESLSTKLSGSDVAVETATKTIQGRLVGLHSEQEGGKGYPVAVKSIVLLSKAGMQRCPLREVQKLEFLDEGVQEEIDKALKRNFQKITPNSTFVELELSAEQQDQKAAIQYTIPAAAWKISYRINLSVDGKTDIQGYAVVDNNTDEDWKDFRVCVVTGQPITFSTDLADSKTPARKHFNLVADEVIGAVEIDEQLQDYDDEMIMAGKFGSPGGTEDVAVMAGYAAPKAKMRRSRSYAFSHSEQPAKRAKVEAAKTEEVGDFCFYQSADLVTVAAKRSAAIPVFDQSLSEAKSVLHYEFDNHPERPFRSIDLKNTLPHSIGKGVCTVYQEGSFAGSCVLPDIKEGQSRLLAHALDTGVVVQRKRERTKNRTTSLQVEKGVCVQAVDVSQKTVYTIRNNHKQKFQFILDHTYGLAQPKQTKALLFADGDSVELQPQSEMKAGHRFQFELAEKATVKLEVSETRTNHNRIELVRVSGNSEHLDVKWLEQNIIKSNGPLSDHPGIAECIKIQGELADWEAKIAAKWKDSGKLQERQERLRKNIKAAEGDPLASRWREDLGDLEDEIREIEDQHIPELNEKRDISVAQLRAALVQLSASWEE